MSSSAPRHKHGSGTDLRLGDLRHKEGRNAPAALPTSACTVLEQHPGTGPSRIKRRVNAKQGFREFQAARRTIQGYEAMNMLRKRQVRWAGKTDVRRQIRFIRKLFELAA